MPRSSPIAAIIAQCIGAAVLYGVLHDQVTARVCIEYFTVFHPRLIASESPTLQGLLWGVLATWWVGLFLGLPLAVVAQAGSLPRVTAAELRRPIGVLLVVMAALALGAGVTGYLLAASRRVSMLDRWAEVIPRERHARFMADLWAHNASYASGFLGGNVLLGWVWRRRHLRSAANTGQEIRGGCGT